MLTFRDTLEQYCSLLPFLLASSVSAEVCLSSLTSVPNIPECLNLMDATVYFHTHCSEIGAVDFSGVCA